MTIDSPAALDSSVGPLHEPNSTPTGRITLDRKLRAYVALTKPRVIELLLVCTLPTMLLAAGGFPDIWLMVVTLVGGALSAGSAGAYNCYFDRDIDARMKRTKDRPLVTGEVSPREALIFATTIGIVSILLLGFFANWLAASLSLAAILFYVVIYTLILKRRTPQNIVWGGIAGCFPVLIGWAAVTNSLAWEPFILFVVVFLWTPPHYWPLSMRYRADYAEVDVPMLAVVRGRTEVGLQIILYTWATVAASLLLIPVGNMGWFYSVVAVATGGWFLWETHRLYDMAVRRVPISPMRVFHGSVSYLTLLFLAVGIDPLLPY